MVIQATRKEWWRWFVS